VRPAAHADREPAACLHARGVDGSRLGLPVGARDRDAHGAHPEAAREARRRPVAPAVPSDRVGRRLPVRIDVMQFACMLAATFAVGLLGVFLIRLLPTLRLQLAGAALLAVSLPLVTVLVSGLVMFEMQDDLKILFLASGAAASVVVCISTLTRSIGRRIDALQATAHRP